MMQLELVINLCLEKRQKYDNKECDMKRGEDFFRRVKKHLVKEVCNQTKFGNKMSPFDSFSKTTLKMTVPSH